MTSSPCLNCSKRTIKPNCHATCEDYRECKVDAALVNIARRVDSDTTDYYSKMILKRRKQRRK